MEPKGKKIEEKNIKNTKIENEKEDNIETSIIINLTNLEKETL
jgi:hypothetical protein